MMRATHSHRHRAVGAAAFTAKCAASLAVLMLFQSGCSPYPDTGRTSGFNSEQAHFTDGPTWSQVAVLATPGRLGAVACLTAEKLPVLKVGNSLVQVAHILR